MTKKIEIGYFDNSLDQSVSKTIKQYNSDCVIVQTDEISKIIEILREVEFKIIFLDENLSHTLKGSALLRVIYKIISPYTLIILISDQKQSIKGSFVYKVLFKSDININLIDELMEGYLQNHSKILGLNQHISDDEKILVEDLINVEKIHLNLKRDLENSKNKKETLDEVANFISSLKEALYE